MNVGGVTGGTGAWTRTVIVLGVAACSRPAAPKRVAQESAGISVCAVGMHAFDGGCVPNISTALPSCPADSIALAGGEFRYQMKGPEFENPTDVQVQPFCMNITEVATSRYRECVTAGACTAPVAHDDEKNAGCNWNRTDAEDHPINCVDWVQATSYCHWRGERLPSRAEFVWAARGGARGSRYPWGNDDPNATRTNACGPECNEWLSLHIWPPAERASFKNSKAVAYETSDGWPTTAPVTSFPAGRSPAGLLNLAGNVAEWTSDVRNGTRAVTCDDYGWRADDKYAQHAEACSVVHQRFANPKELLLTSYDINGFRCAK